MIANNFVWFDDKVRFSVGAEYPRCIISGSVYRPVPPPSPPIEHRRRAVVMVAARPQTGRGVRQTRPSFAGARCGEAAKRAQALVVVVVVVVWSNAGAPSP